MTPGLLVLVQLVMAAITTEPWPRAPSRFGPTLAASPFAKRPLRSPRNVCFMALRLMRSWGRVGPARLGSTAPMSRLRVSLNSGVGLPSVTKRFCSLQ